jgi:plasmid stability protein
MTDLVLHDVDDAIVRALAERANEHGRSAEAEHRAILADALFSPRPAALVEALMTMPAGGTDGDFARVQSSKAAPRVFD